MMNLQGDTGKAGILFVAEIPLYFKRKEDWAISVGMIELSEIIGLRANIMLQACKYHRI